LAADLWEKGILTTKEPLETIDGDVFDSDVVELSSGDSELNSASDSDSSGSGSFIGEESFSESSVSEGIPLLVKVGKKLGRK
jgi:hypothetical protein